MDFNTNLNNLPEDLIRIIYYHLFDKLYFLNHKNKFKLSINFINKKRHYIYNNLNYYKYFYKMQYDINSNYMNQIPCDYIDICTNLYYIYFRYNKFNCFLKQYRPKQNKINGYYKKKNPSINDETYYKLKYRNRKTKNHYNRNRNKYSIKDMRR